MVFFTEQNGNSLRLIGFLLITDRISYFIRLIERSYQKEAERC